MNIVLMEPLGISAETLDKLAATLTRHGHQFTAYDSFTLDTDELIARGADADVMIIANHPLPAAVIEAASHLKLVSVAFVGIDHVDTAADAVMGNNVANTAINVSNDFFMSNLFVIITFLLHLTSAKLALNPKQSKFFIIKNKMANEEDSKQYRMLHSTVTIHR